MNSLIRWSTGKGNSILAVEEIVLSDLEIDLHQARIKFHYLSNHLGCIKRETFIIDLAFHKCIVANLNDYLEHSSQLCFLRFFVIQTMKIKHNLVTVQCFRDFYKCPVDIRGKWYHILCGIWVISLQIWFCLIWYCILVVRTERMTRQNSR